MYYKVMYNDRVIDVLDHLTYVKYQPQTQNYDPVPRG